MGFEPCKAIRSSRMAVGNADSYRHFAFMLALHDLFWESGYGLDSVDTYTNLYERDQGTIRRLRLDPDLEPEPISVPRNWRPSPV
jgi:hypothetical protein